MVALRKGPATDQEKAEESRKATTVLNKEILDGLQTVQKFGASLQAAIGKVQSLSSKDASVSQAREGVATAIKAAMSTILSGRRQSMDQYETAVLIIGQTAGLPQAE